MKVYNFGAGPSAISVEVLDKASKGVLEYTDSLSILEISHRGKEYQALQDNLKLKLANLLKIPQGYSILFMTGGGSAQFSSIPMNFLSQDDCADYIITGSWSKKAYEEATKLGYKVKIAADSKQEFGAYTSISKSFSFDKEAKYVYYCDNETIEGVQFDFIPNTDVPLICDMSSSLLSKPIDVSKYALIFAGAQKNLGAAGVTIVIIKDELIDSFPDHKTRTPAILDYKVMHKNDSCYNTPPVFNIFVTDLVLEWIINNPQFKGDLDLVHKYNKEKASILYEELEKSRIFYCPVDKDSRSIMNVVFKIKDEHSQLNDKFIKATNDNLLIQLQGHRSVGGYRASLYNSVSLEGCLKLKEIIEKFE